MDEILINGKKMDINDDTLILLDFQACDVTKPDTVQASFSNVFEVPDTKNNQKIAEFAGQINAKTTVPYKQNEARLFSSGIEVLTFGKATLEEYNPGSSQSWQIFSGNKDFFDVIDGKSIRDLSFSQFDHIYNAENVVNSRLNTYQKGYVYDFINRKNVLQQKFPWYDLLPSTFCRVIWDQIFKEADFTYVWDRPADNAFDKMILPCVDPPELTDEFVEARSAYVSAKGWRQNESPQNLDSEDVYFDSRGSRIIRFKNDSEDGYSQGDAQLFNTAGYFWQADGTYFVDVLIYVPFSKINVTAGKITVHVKLNHKGVTIVDNDIQVTGVKFTSNQVIEVRIKRLLVNNEDKLEGWITIFRNTNIAVYDVIIADSSAVYMDIKVRKDFPPNALVKLQNFLPDISQKEFVKAILFMHCGILETNGSDKSVKFTEFNKVLERIPIAKDWSTKVTNLSSPKKKYRFGEFGQRSWIKYRVSDEDLDLTKGDGYLTVNNTLLPANVDIVELPFAYTEVRLGLPYIEMFTKKDDEESTTDENMEIDYDSKSATPRILINDLRAYDLLSYLDNEKNVIPIPDNRRPVSRFLPELSAKTTIIPNYWKTFSALLDDTRFIEVECYLTAKDIENLEFSVPVYISSQWIEGAYFYINKIIQWADNEPCTVELVRL